MSKPPSGCSPKTTAKKSGTSKNLKTSTSEDVVGENKSDISPQLLHTVIPSHSNKGPSTTFLELRSLAMEQSPKNHGSVMRSPVSKSAQSVAVENTKAKSLTKSSRYCNTSSVLDSSVPLSPHTSRHSQAGYSFDKGYQSEDSAACELTTTQMPNLKLKPASSIKLSSRAKSATNTEIKYSHSKPVKILNFVSPKSAEGVRSRNYKIRSCSNDTSTESASENSSKAPESSNNKLPPNGRTKVSAEPTNIAQNKVNEVTEDASYIVTNPQLSDNQQLQDEITKLSQTLDTALETSNTAKLLFSDKENMGNVAIDFSLVCENGRCKDCILYDGGAKPMDVTFLKPVCPKIRLSNDTSPQTLKGKTTEPTNSEPKAHLANTIGGILRPIKLEDYRDYCRNDLDRELAGVYPDSPAKMPQPECKSRTDLSKDIDEAFSRYSEIVEGKATHQFKDRIPTQIDNQIAAVQKRLDLNKLLLESTRNRVKNIDFSAERKRLQDMKHATFGYPLSDEEAEMLKNVARASNTATGQHQEDSCPGIKEFQRVMGDAIDVMERLDEMSDSDIHKAFYKIPLSETVFSEEINLKTTDK